jgi:hypothetical protein
MPEQQSWESCKYHLGNLDIDLEDIARTDTRVKLWLAIFPRTALDELFRKEGINQQYYCTNSELVKLQAYWLDELIIKKKEYIPVARLFSLDISTGPGLDWFGSDRRDLERAIKDGLRMCAHCKFYTGNSS